MTTPLKFDKYRLQSLVSELKEFQTEFGHENEFLMMIEEKVHLSATIDLVQDCIDWSEKGI